MTTTKPATASKKNATKSSKSKPAAKPAKKADAVERDAMGCRKGSQSATINAALTKKPQACAAIAEATKLDANRVRSHLKFLVAKKFVVESDDGYRLK